MHKPIDALRAYDLVDRWPLARVREEMRSLNIELFKLPKVNVAHGDITRMRSIDSTELLVRVVYVGAATAMEWLKASRRNRSINARKLGDIIRSVEDKTFTLNGEPIIFDRTGVLIDGHHRLKAVAITGIAVRMLCVWGVEPEAFASIDQGLSRTRSDVLGMGDVKSARAASSLLRLLAIFERDGSIGVGESPVNNMNVLLFMERFPGIKDSVDPIVFNKTSMGLRKASAGLAHYLFSRIDPVFAQEFWRGLTSGSGLYERDPRIALAKALTLMAAGKRKLHSGGSRDAQFAKYLFKAWTSWVHGRTLAQFRDTEPLKLPEGVEMLMKHDGGFDLTRQCVLPPKFYANPKHKSFLGHRYLGE